jgi:hypothetical protein
MTDIIETNFSQIKEILHQNKQEVINAITTEKNRDIAKDGQIIKLTSKQGELKGKNELISTLNLNIDKLQ